VPTVAVSAEKAHIRRRDAGDASGETRHLVSASGRFLGDRMTQPRRATEHKKPHHDS
jgi:hypothetical protein